MSGKGKGLSRREFLKTAGAGAVLGPAVMSAASWARVIGANDRIRIGIIGTGGMAGHHLKQLSTFHDEDNFDVVAVCDVFESRMKEYAERAKKLYGIRPAMFDDYHELLGLGDIDKVLITTPEHWHQRITLDALAEGKHVYVEKPMTHTIGESLHVLEAAEKSGLCVQVGSQITSDDKYEVAHEYIASGKLGQLIQIQSSYVRRYPPNKGPWRTGHTSDEPKPPDLDWGFWLGPARKRPWDARRFWDWRNYWDYSGGIGTDLFVHRATELIKACSLEEPVRAVGMGGIFMWDDGRELPDNFEMIAEYPGGPTFYILGTMANDHGIDTVIRGYEGTMVFEGNGFNVYPIRKPKQEYKPIFSHQSTRPGNVIEHHKNHHAAMRAGKPDLCICPAILGHYGVMAVNMANESYRRRAMIAWDPKRRRMVRASGGHILQRPDGGRRG